MGRAHRSRAYHMFLKYCKLGGGSTFYCYTKSLSSSRISRLQSERLTTDARLSELFKVSKIKVSSWDSYGL